MWKADCVGVPEGYTHEHAHACELNKTKTSEDMLTHIWYVCVGLSVAECKKQNFTVAFNVAIMPVTLAATVATISI